MALAMTAVAGRGLGAQNNHAAVVCSGMFHSDTENCAFMCHSKGTQTTSINKSRSTNVPAHGGCSVSIEYPHHKSDEEEPQ